MHLKCLHFIQRHLDTLVGNWINLGSREGFGVISSTHSWEQKRKAWITLLGESKENEKI